MTDWQALAALAAVPPTNPTIAVTSPLDGAVLGHVPAATPDDLRAAVTRARAAQAGWDRLGPWPRADVLAHFAKAVCDHQDEFLDLVHAENGKARIHALDEVLDVIQTAAYLASHAPRQLRPERRRGALPLLTATRVRYRPQGVVGVIAPWNYPLSLAAVDALAALAAGNAVVLKPDSATPLTALLVARCLAEAGLPDGVLQVVPGSGRDLGTPLIEAVDHVMFTGSTATGREVAAQCGRLLKDCSAELGGKNPMLVLADADVPRAARGAVTACFHTTGQCCMSIERLYLHDAVYDRFLAEFIPLVEALRLGAGDGWDVDLGPLISAAHLAKVQAHVDNALAQGARAVTGGAARPDVGPLFFAPTVLEGVDATMALAREETFGPVVAVYRVADDDAAVAAANDTEYGLNASVWGEARHAAAVARRLTAGVVNVNEGFMAGYGSVDAPMGGTGISGLGRRHGPEGLRGFTNPQTIARQRLLNIAVPPGVTRQTYARATTRLARFLYPGRGV
ncbi:MAG: aldehyde dehydrogenase family protein [Propionibacteriaceae bacterium]|jgi:succinate-semialdehyde dehydrogenase/glutarate-semialdehyde dehydrogenase|nr:aldehyde dehydrogenase family protein [Propionibacteriaceae bacterium]